MVYEFGARLLQLRKAKKLTQKALADRAKAFDPDLRLSDSVIGKYESDHAVPRLTEAAALAEVLGVSLDFLTSGETSRTLPLKGLSDRQIQLLLDLAQTFRKGNERPPEVEESEGEAAEKMALIARLMQEIVR